MASVTAATVGAGVHAQATVSSVGNQHQHADSPPCHADFSVTETAEQLPGAMVEPTVNVLTATSSVSCDYTDGYLSTRTTIVGAASCNKAAPFSTTALSASTQCSVFSPPPGLYEVLFEVDWGVDGVMSWTTDETVLPGTVPTVAEPIGNQSQHFFDIAPCHMWGSMTESLAPQTVFAPAGLVQTITATATMTCDYFIYEANYVTVKMVSEDGRSCSAQTPQVPSENTTFSASCSLGGSPGAYTAVFTFTNQPQSPEFCCPPMVTTAGRLQDVIL